MNTYEISCECKTIKIRMEGVPRVRGTCHCGDCRTLLNIPYHMVNAWLPEQITVVSGEDHLARHQHPSLNMKRVYCDKCGETVFNTNGAGWTVMSQLIVAKNYGEIPEPLTSQMHFFYDRRIVDVNDDLPKR